MVNGQVGEATGRGIIRPSFEGPPSQTVETSTGLRFTETGEKVFTGTPGPGQRVLSEKEESAARASARLRSPPGTLFVTPRGQIVEITETGLRPVVSGLNVEGGLPETRAIGRTVETGGSLRVEGKGAATNIRDVKTGQTLITRQVEEAAPTRVEKKEPEPTKPGVEEFVVTEAGVPIATTTSEFVDQIKKEIEAEAAKVEVSRQARVPVGDLLITPPTGFEPFEKKTREIFIAGEVVSVPIEASAEEVTNLILSNVEKIAGVSRGVITIPPEESELEKIQGDIITKIAEVDEDLRERITDPFGEFVTETTGLTLAEVEKLTRQFTRKTSEIALTPLELIGRPRELTLETARTAGEVAGVIVTEPARFVKERPGTVALFAAGGFLVGGATGALGVSEAALSKAGAVGITLSAAAITARIEEQESAIEKARVFARDVLVRAPAFVAGARVGTGFTKADIELQNEIIKTADTETARLTRILKPAKGEVPKKGIFTKEFFRVQEPEADIIARTTFKVGEPGKPLTAKTPLKETFAKISPEKEPTAFGKRALREIEAITQAKFIAKTTPGKLVEKQLKLLSVEERLNAARLLRTQTTGELTQELLPAREVKPPDVTKIIKETRVVVFDQPTVAAPSPRKIPGTSLALLAPGKKRVKIIDEVQEVSPFLETPITTQITEEIILEDIRRRQTGLRVEQQISIQQQTPLQKLLQEQKKTTILIQGQTQRRGQLQVEKQLQKLLQQQEQTTEQIQGQTQTQIQQQTTEQTQTQEQKQEQTQKQIQEQIQRQIQDQETPPLKDIEIILPKLGPPREKEKVEIKEPGFDVFVRRKKKFVKVNVKKRTETDAKALGMFVVDNEPAATFKIKKVGIAQVPTKNRNIFDFLDKKFDEIDKNTFREFNRFRIDSAGEVQGIPLKAAELRRRGLIEPKKTRKTTPRKTRGVKTEKDMLKLVRKL